MKIIKNQPKQPKMNKYVQVQNSQYRVSLELLFRIHQDTVFV